MGSPPQDRLLERWLGLPEVASAHGGQVDHVTLMVHGLMFALFLLWGGFFVYSLWRFRQGAHPRAHYAGLRTRAPGYVEVAVAGVEVALLVGFSIPLYSQWVDDLPPESDATVVRVVAQQFAWNIHYPGPDGVFGPTDPALIDPAENPLGIDRESDAGQDDVSTVNRLHVPVDKPVLIHLSSQDVVHSFGVTEFRVKQDAIPGSVFPVWFEPTITTDAMRDRKGDPAFDYEIGCFQLCGNSHATMRGFVIVETQAGFEAWMDEEQSYLGDDFW